MLKKSFSHCANNTNMGFPVELSWSWGRILMTRAARPQSLWKLQKILFGKITLPCARSFIGQGVLLTLVSIHRWIRNVYLSCWKCLCRYYFLSPNGLVSLLLLAILYMARLACWLVHRFALVHYLMRRHLIVRRNLSRSGLTQCQSWDPVTLGIVLGDACLFWSSAMWLIPHSSMYAHFSLIKLLFVFCSCTCLFFGTDWWRFQYPTTMLFDYHLEIALIYCQHTSATIFLQCLMMSTILSLTRIWQQLWIRTSTRSVWCRQCNSKQWTCCQSIPSLIFLLATLIQALWSNREMLTDICLIIHFKRWMTSIRYSKSISVSLNLSN